MLKMSKRNIRRFPRLQVVAVVLLLLCRVPCPGLSRAEGFPPDIKRIMDRGKLIVAMYYKDIPPFFMHSSRKDAPARHVGTASPFIPGEYFYGVDVKIALEMAQRLGVPCEFHRESRDFGEIVEAVEDHRADVAVTLMSRTLERSTRVLFSRPYVVLHHGLLLNRVALTKYEKGTPLKDFINTPRMKIGVKSGIAWSQFLRRYFPKASITSYPTWDGVVDAVRKGTVMAAYADELEIKKLTVSKPAVAVELKTVIIEDIRDPIAMAVAWDSPHLLQWINTYLEQEKVTMTVDDILNENLDSVKGPASREFTEQGGENE